MSSRIRPDWPEEEERFDLRARAGRDDRAAAIRREEADRLQFLEGGLQLLPHLPRGIVPAQADVGEGELLEVPAPLGPHVEPLSRNR
jgi:hypothetical protein